MFSGKSLVYQLVILDDLTRQGGRALVIFPTKALAQDQLASFRRLVARSPALDWVTINTYDGDTPAETRAKVRETSHIILTNPDMLHYAILPQCNATWNTFLSRLSLLVLDGTHPRLPLIFRNARLPRALWATYVACHAAAPATDVRSQGDWLQRHHLQPC